MLAEETRQALRSVCPSKRGIVYGYIAAALWFIFAIIVSYLALLFRHGRHYLLILVLCFVFLGALILGMVLTEGEIRRRVLKSIREDEADTGTEQGVEQPDPCD